jgi:hypothetical protein
MRESFHNIIKKKFLKKANRSLKDIQRTLNYSTTSISNGIYPSFPSTTNNSNSLIFKNNNYNESNNENNRSLKKLEQYSNLLFINETQKIKNTKSELDLLKQGLDFLINDNIINKKTLTPKINLYNSITYRNISKKRELFPLTKIPYKKTMDMKKIKIRNAILGNDNKIDIFKKLKKSKSILERYKYERANIIEKLTKYEFKEKQRDISIIFNDNIIKKQKINEIHKLVNNEKKMLDKNFISLNKSYDKINNVYKKKTESLYNLLYEKAMKENIINNEMILTKKQLNKQIFELNDKIKELNQEKIRILNWIYLLIRIKEKKLNLEKYYFEIIGNNMNYESLLRQYDKKKISKEEYNRIYLYKANLVFNDIDEFYEKMKIIDKKILLILDEKEDKKKNKNEKEIMKLKELKNEITVNEEEKNLNKELWELKGFNKELKINNKNEYNPDRNNDDEIANTNIKNKGKLFSFAMGLFEEFNKLKFNKAEFNINIFDKKERIILDIIKIFEINYNYLKKEKKYYLSKKELRNKYKNEEIILKKEKIYEKFIKKSKLNEKLIKLRNEKIQKRMSSQSFLPLKKIDYEFYLGEKIKLDRSHKKVYDENEIIQQYFFYH